MAHLITCRETNKCFLLMSKPVQETCCLPNKPSLCFHWHYFLTIMGWGKVIRVAMALVYGESCVVFFLMYHKLKLFISIMGIFQRLTSQIESQVKFWGFPSIQISSCHILVNMTYHPYLEGSS